MAVAAAAIVRPPKIQAKVCRAMEMSTIQLPAALVVSMMQAPWPRLVTRGVVGHR